MAKAAEGKNSSGGLLRRLNSLRVQLGAIVLVSYLIPAVLLGTFTGTVLLRGLEEKTRSAVSSSAEHAFTMTKQNVSRAIELARGATYDGELTVAWEKWQAGDAADTLICCAMILFSLFSGRGIYLDIAIIGAMLGIIDTLLVGRYLEGRGWNDGAADRH